MIRVAAYNLSGLPDPGAAAAVLLPLQCELVCAIETPGRLALKRLARRTGLEVVGRAGRGRLGVAVLAGERVRILSASRHDLARLVGLPHRSTVQVIASVEGARVVVFPVQLGLRPEARERHATELTDLIGKVDAAAIVAGDLNEPPGGVASEQFTELLDDAYTVAGERSGVTYPNPDPAARRDYVFVARTLEVVRAWVPDEPPVAIASHHRPVVAELRVVPRADRESDSLRGRARDGDTEEVA
ncbi:MAG: endonuclease/exonuclease/phosphatase family protein [Nitriliruptorales bacterium]